MATRMATAFPTWSITRSSLNSPAPLGPGAPTVVREPGALSIVYRQLVMANAPQYVVQKSTDAKSWTTVATTDSLVAVTGNVQTIKAKVYPERDARFPPRADLTARALTRSR